MFFPYFQGNNKNQTKTFTIEREEKVGDFIQKCASEIGVEAEKLLLIEVIIVVGGYLFVIINFFFSRCQAQKEAWKDLF